MPVLLYHDRKAVVGSAVPVYEKDKLVIRGTFAKTTLAEEARHLVVDKHITKMSVGFANPTKAKGSDGIVHIRSGELVEVSFVSVPANSDAEVIMARSHNPELALARANAELIIAEATALLDDDDVKRTDTLVRQPEPPQMTQEAPRMFRRSKPEPETVVYYENTKPTVPTRDLVSLGTMDRVGDKVTKHGLMPVVQTVELFVERGPGNGFSTRYWYRTKDNPNVLYPSFDTEKNETVVSAMADPEEQRLYRALYPRPQRTSNPNLPRGRSPSRRTGDRDSHREGHARRRVRPRVRLPVDVSIGHQPEQVIDALMCALVATLSKNSRST